MSRRPLVRAAAATLLLGAIAILSNGAREADAVEDSGPPLLVQGEALRRAEAYRSADLLLGRALQQARAAGDRAAESDALAALARVQDGLGDKAAAERRRAEALAIARALGDRGREACALSDAGAASWARADYASAERLLRQALAQQRALGDRQGEAATLVRLGRVPFKQGRYDEALALYAQALALQERASDLSGTATTEVAVGLVHLDRRAFSAAMAAFRRAQDAAERAGDLEQRIVALDHLAIGWMFQGAPEEARAPLDEALRLAKAGRNRPLEMKVRHLLANVDRQAGHHHAAIAAYQELAAYCESEGNLREAAWNHARRAKAEATLGRLEDAKQSHRTAIAQWDAMGDRRPLAFAEYDLARLHERCGELDLALATYERARAAEREIALPYESLLLSDLALLEARRGRIEAARRWAVGGVEAADAVANPEMRWVALLRLAKVERMAGHRDEARRALVAALEVIESLRVGVEPSDEAKAGFMEGKQEAYAEAVDLLVEMGRPEEALEVSERARARALLDLIAGAAPDARGPAAQEFPAHVASPKLAPPATVAEIRAFARRTGATVLEYSTGAERSVVFAIDAEGTVRSAAIPAGAAELARQIAALRRALGGEGNAPPAAGPTRVARTALRTLYAQLVGPVADALPRGGASRVVIVPHGPLFLLPFACLVDPDGSYLVERFGLSYAPSIGTLREVAARRGGAPGRPASVLAVGNPRGRTAPGHGDAGALPDLPAAEAEARAVAALFPAPSSILLTGTAASEERVRALAPGRSVVHIAAHAVVREDAPLASYLALAAGSDVDAAPGVRAAPATASDGRLTAREVLDLPLDADLVVLSGCQTGLGAISGDGVSGLARAFLHAGAASLVVSLWRVADDVGRDVMTRFQQALQVDGRDAAEALRRAQLATIDDLRRGALRDPAGAALAESPLYWAPFVLVGGPADGSPAEGTSTNPSRGRPSQQRE